MVQLIVNRSDIMEKARPFRIVIVYENVPTAIRAREMSEQLAVDSECESWSFDLLGIAGVREHAALVASEADMIIVAARGDQALPAVVKDWIESWVPVKKSVPGALVALLDADASNQSSPYLYLQQIAGRGKMDFLSNVSGWLLRTIRDEQSQYFGAPNNP